MYLRLLVLLFPGQKPFRVRINCSDALFHGVVNLRLLVELALHTKITSPKLPQ
jgi:hypothetical protein